MRHILFTTLFTVSIGTSVFAGDPVSCTISKVCEGPAECIDINMSILLNLSDTSVELSFDSENLILDMVAGELGSGTTYAGKDINNTFTILTVLEDGSGFMSGHKLGADGKLFTAQLNCEVSDK